MANYFINSYKYEWDTAQESDDYPNLDNLKLYIKMGSSAEKICFTIPTLYCYGAKSNGKWESSPLCEVNTKTTIYRQQIVNGQVQSKKEEVDTIYSGATSFTSKNDDVAYVTESSAYLRRLKTGVTYNYEAWDVKQYNDSTWYSYFPALASTSESYIKQASFTIKLPDSITKENIDGWYYTIESVADPTNSSGMISYYEAISTSYSWAKGVTGWLFGYENYRTIITQKSAIQVDFNQIKVSTGFYYYFENPTTTTFTMSAQKYNLYQLFRKALLTVDTQLIDNSSTGIDDLEYPIIIDPAWKNRLESTQIYETILETKNLWEIFQQIGKYLHAEPRMYFVDGTDQLMLSFLQLGQTDSKTDSSTKTTIYNSKALSQYFASYDSYVTNLYSPQNICHEFLVPKCSDSTYLVSNNTAMLETKYGIQQIEDLKLYYPIGNSYYALPIYNTITTVNYEQSESDDGSITSVSGKTYYDSAGNITGAIANVTKITYPSTGTTTTAGYSFAGSSETITSTTSTEYYDSTLSKTTVDATTTTYTSTTSGSGTSKTTTVVTKIYSGEIADEENLIEESEEVYPSSTSIALTSDSILTASNAGLSLSLKSAVSTAIETTEEVTMIFEKAIYECLTSSYEGTPSKADTLYYSMGDNHIYGLNYIPSSENNDQLMALKKLIKELMNKFYPDVEDENIAAANMKFNDIVFEIRYRTQDDTRLTQVRPDMEDFIKVSSFEKYPHHEQYYNQLDKIPDSERFSANMWGQLVRNGNAVIQCQEYCLVGEEKEEGDLYIIDNLPYYVTEVDSEYYNDIVMQKVTYSAYWNEASMITSQNCENRMYEISEKSTTRREVRMMEFVKISSEKPDTISAPKFLNSTNWKSFIENLIFYYDEYIIYPNFAYTKFLADSKRIHTGSYDQFVSCDELFPSSEVEYLYDDETGVLTGISPKKMQSFSEIMVPLLMFPKKDGILFEWDMEDNFQAGTFVDTAMSGKDSSTDDAYYAQQSARYVDIMGRADLFQFRLFNIDNSEITTNYVRKLTLAPDDLIPTSSDCNILTPDEKSIVLDKDSREALSFEFQINLLYDKNMVTFSNLFGKKDAKLKLMLYDKEIGMFDQVYNILGGNVIADDVEYAFDTSSYNYITMSIAQPTDLSSDSLSEVKSLIWYDGDETSKAIYFVVNVADKEDNEKLSDLYIYPVYSD